MSQVYIYSAVFIIAVLLVNVFLAILMSSWDAMQRAEALRAITPDFVHPPVSLRTRLTLMRLPHDCWTVGSAARSTHAPGLGWAGLGWTGLD